MIRTALLRLDASAREDDPYATTIFQIDLAFHEIGHLGRGG